MTLDNQLGGQNTTTTTQRRAIDPPLPVPEKNAAGGNERKVMGGQSGQMPWFHGKISRELAEKLLTPRKDGLFLVRESTNFPGI